MNTPPEYPADQVIVLAGPESLVDDAELTAIEAYANGAETAR